MFNLKTLLLITIASKACLAQMKDLFDIASRCDIETCPPQEDWKDYFIKGECKMFYDTIAKLKDWNQKREELPTLIESSYTRHIQLAENIYECLSGLNLGSKFEVYENMVKGFTALGRVLNKANQRATPVSLKAASLMSQLNFTVRTTFNKSNQLYLEGFVKLYKNELLPSIKSMFFDHWVFINYTEPDEPFRTLTLAISEYHYVNLWPIPNSIIGNSQLKWDVTQRVFRVNRLGAYVVDVIFKSADRRWQLTSEENGDVSATMIGSLKSGSYHVWTAEFVRLNMNDGMFRFKNKQTCKYLCTNKYNYPKYQDYKPGPIQALSLATHHETFDLFTLS